MSGDGNEFRPPSGITHSHGAAKGSGNRPSQRLPYSALQPGWKHGQSANHATTPTAALPQSVTGQGAQRRKNRPPPTGEKPAEEHSSKSDTGTLSTAISAIPALGAVAMKRPIASEDTGFLLLCEETFSIMQSADDKLVRRMTYSMFLHVMVTFLQCRRFMLAIESSRARATIRGELRDGLLLDEATIPASIYDYLVRIGEFVDPLKTVRYTNEGEHLLPLNWRAIPAIAADEQANVLAQAGFEIGGDFGPCDGNSHVVYEARISPYITGRRLQHQLANPGAAVPWVQPLPAQFVPPNSVPNANLLGFGPIEPMLADAQSRILNPVWCRDGVLGALNHCPSIYGIVQDTLRQLGAKSFKMRTGFPYNTRGSQEQVMFVRSDNDNPLYTAAVRVCSLKGATESEVGAAAIFCNRRERTENNPGCCYTVNGAAIPAWVDSRNDYFNQVGHFVPPIDDEPNNVWNIVEWTDTVIPNRRSVVHNWIRNHCLIQK